MEPGAPELAMNDVGEIRVRTSKPVIYDGFASNRLTGSFILIEQGTNATVGAGMLHPPTEIARPEYRDFAILARCTAPVVRACHALLPALGRSGAL